MFKDFLREALARKIRLRMILQSKGDSGKNVKAAENLKEEKEGIYLWCLPASLQVEEPTAREGCSLHCSRTKSEALQCNLGLTQSAMSGASLVEGNPGLHTKSPSLPDVYTSYSQPLPFYYT